MGAREATGWRGSCWLRGCVRLRAALLSRLSSSSSSSILSSPRPLPQSHSLPPSREPPALFPCLLACFPHSLPRLPFFPHAPLAVFFSIPPPTHLGCPGCFPTKLRSGKVGGGGSRQPCPAISNQCFPTRLASLSLCGKKKLGCDGGDKSAVVIIDDLLKKQQLLIIFLLWPQECFSSPFLSHKYPSISLSFFFPVPLSAPFACHFGASKEEYYCAVAVTC